MSFPPSSSADALPPHEQLGVLAASLQHDLANHGSALVGLTQLLETTPPGSRDGVRLFAELQRALGRFQVDLAEFTRMRRALTLPTPTCGMAVAVAALRAGLGDSPFTGAPAPEEPRLVGEPRWFGFLGSALVRAAGRTPTAAVFTAHLPQVTACAGLSLIFASPVPEAIAAFADRARPQLSPELTVAREILVRLDARAEIVPQRGNLELRLRFKHASAPLPSPR